MRARSESDTSTPSVARASRSTRSGSGALRASRRSATAAALGRRAGTAVALGAVPARLRRSAAFRHAVALGLRRRARRCRRWRDRFARLCALPDAAAASSASRRAFLALRAAILSASVLIFAADHQHNCGLRMNRFERESAMQVSTVSELCGAKKCLESAELAAVRH